VGVVLLVDIVLLLDLRRRQVTGLPRWGWAAVILLVSFPVGALLYWFAGRVRPEDATRATDAAPAPADRIAGPAQETALPAEDVAWEPQGAVVLATRGLCKQYDDVAAVDGVELRVPRGSVYGLIGPNGAGKTTLLDLVAGLRSPTAGRIELDVDRQRVAVLPDTPQFEPWLTGREVVALAAHLAGLPPDAGRVTAALADVDLAAAADRRTRGWSRGMLQRLGLATCLVAEPELLVLDEPSSALDPAGRREVLDLVGRLAGQRTVLLSTHVLSDVQQVCDIVGVLQSGRLVFQGPIDDLLVRTSSVYRLRVGASDDVEDRLRAAPWVQEIVREGVGGFRLVVSDVGAAEANVAGALAEAGVALHAFGPASDLESAFLDLTGGPA
jgi:ABC-2 type transport system ATP-binding protein